MEANKKRKCPFDKKKHTEQRFYNLVSKIQQKKNKKKKSIDKPRWLRLFDRKHTKRSLYSHVKAKNKN